MKLAAALKLCRAGRLERVIVFLWMVFSYLKLSFNLKKSVYNLQRELKENKFFNFILFLLRFLFVALLPSSVLYNFINQVHFHVEVLFSSTKPSLKNLISVLKACVRHRAGVLK